MTEDTSDPERLKIAFETVLLYLGWAKENMIEAHERQKALDALDEIERQLPACRLAFSQDEQEKH